MTEVMTKWQELFDEYDAANPHVYAWFEQKAAEVYRPGRRIGIALLINQFRWEQLVKTDSNDQFKINENYATYYARKLVRDHPEYEGMFEFMRLRSE